MSALVGHRGPVGRNIFTRALADRWLSFALAATIIVALLAMGMAVYQDIDLSIYTGLPPAVQELIGIGGVGDPAGLAYAAIYSSYGALTLCSVAIAMGAATIAGEERKGTIGVLLANPVSRSRVLAAKIAALVVLVLTGAAVLLAGGLVIPALLGTQIAGQDVLALMLHMAFLAVFFGLLAVAIGAWTGSNGSANGISAAILVLSFFAVGLLPLLPDWAEAARVFPWHYYSGSDPLANGIDSADLLVLAASAVGCLMAAFLGVRRRDLRSRSTGTSLLDRLRRSRFVGSAAERLAGSARVRGIASKTASDFQGLLMITSAIMFALMGVFVTLVYSAIDDSVKSLGDTLPEALLALFGGGDIATVEGYLQVETFGLMGPIAVLLLTVVIGARALAGEEEGRTMGLLLANPVRRRDVVFRKFAVVVLAGFVVAFATFAGVTLGDMLGGLGLAWTNVAAASALMLLLGVLFGGIALLLSAATGRVAVAIWGTVGLALASHVLNAFLPLSESLASLARLTPHYYYLSSDPLATGMAWGHAAVLVVGSVIVLLTAIAVFDRRDLRNG